jgi:hypothetical protein
MSPFTFLIEISFLLLCLLCRQYRFYIQSSQYPASSNSEFEQVLTDICFQNIRYVEATAY